MRGVDADAEERTHYELDLKYAVWESEREGWEDREPGMYDAIKAQVEQGVRVTISSAPRKECSYGYFRLERIDTGEYQADASFTDAWDEPRDLLSSLNVRVDDDSEDDAVEEIESVLSLTDNGEPGYTSEKLVSGETFEALCVAIEVAYAEHNAAMEEAWKELVDSTKERLKVVRWTSAPAGDGYGTPPTCADTGGGWGDGGDRVEDRYQTRYNTAERLESL